MATAKEILDRQEAQIRVELDKKINDTITNLSTTSEKDLTDANQAIKKAEEQRKAIEDLKRLRADQAKIAAAKAAQQVIDNGNTTGATSTRVSTTV